MMKRCIVLLTTLVLGAAAACSQPGSAGYVSEEKTRKAFTLAGDGEVAPIFVSSTDPEGVIRAAGDLRSDLQKVTGTLPELVILEPGQLPEVDGSQEIIVVGSLGASHLIDPLLQKLLPEAGRLAGAWESALTAVVENPFPGTGRALVICGSDKRGTIYGIYELSAQIGVSPWHFWADVVPPERGQLFVPDGAYWLESPKVTYRGIFINDEAPALAGWAHERYGGFNHQFYAQVFELILRMKGNYLWPAMWGRAFYDDDPLNAPLADEYGIVIGTSHHEPMMRAHVEWSRYGEGPWDYRENSGTLSSFWREGIQRMDTFESIVSVGMRGDGDEPMTQGTAIGLLESIVADQREILAEVTGRPPEETPQLWALYKEVQDYYDEGMRVPDDVTLLLCDDNWGNLRMLPKAGETERDGGYGIYYHFDYVGGPRNYKWLNTNQIERIWEQMHLAYAYGADRIWIVNVGDIKPMELPTQFFLDMAWDPDRWNPDNLAGYYLKWSTRQFGPRHAKEIAGILASYTRFNARRKPELLAPGTYSLDHYREAERIVGEYRELEKEAEKIYRELPAAQRDAYYQLVLFPVSACANLNELYVAAAKNKRYAEQGRAAANRMARRTRELFATDSLLTHYFHTGLSGGKWNHMMAQTHIGYTYWQQPDRNNMPEVREIPLTDGATMGMAIEGSDQAWPGSAEIPLLPEADPQNRQEYYLEVFNRGTVPFRCNIEPSEPWIVPSVQSVEINDQERIHLWFDWEKVPSGQHRVPVEVTGPEGSSVTVYAQVDNRPLPSGTYPEGIFLPDNRIVSMEAASYHRAAGNENILWKEVPNLGRTRSAMIALPVTEAPGEPGGDSPHLEYMFLTKDTGLFTIHSYLAPTLDFHRGEGLKFAVSVDNGTPEVVNMHPPGRDYLWNRWVSNNTIVASTEIRIGEPGIHTLKWWRVDGAVVLQRIIVAPRGRPIHGYLGPPESIRLVP